MAIELPDLVQRIRVRTDEVRAAGPLVDRLGTRFDKLRAKSSDASDSMDELGESTERYNLSAERTGKSTDAVIKAIQTLDRTTVATTGSMGDGANETSNLRRVIAEVGDESDLTSNSVSRLGTSVDNVSDSTRNTYTEMNRLRTTIKDVGTETERTRRSTIGFGKDTDRTGNSVSSFVKKSLAAVGVIKLIGLAFKGIFFATIIAGLGQIASLLFSLSAGAIALTSALGPAIGLAGALPAAFLGLTSSIFLIKQLTGGVGDAVKAINTYGPASKEAAEAVAGLSGNTKDLAIAYGKLKFAFNDVIQEARRAALPEFGIALQLLTGLIPKLSDEIGGLAEVIGGLAERGAQLVTSGPFSRDIQTVLERNNELIFTMGLAGLKLVNVLRNLVVAAGPMTQRLADLALAGAKWLNTVVATGRESGTLRAFFADALGVASQLVQILADLTVGLFNVFSVGRDLGDDLLKTLQKNAAEFRRWTDSAGGRNAILEFFNDARPVLRQTGLLLSALVAAFFRLNHATAKSSVAPLLKQMRVQLLPVVEKLITRLSKGGLLSSVGDLLTAFVRLANNLPFNPLVKLVRGVADVINAVRKAIKEVPGLGSVLANVFLIFGAFKVAGFAAKILGLGAAFEFLSDIIGGLLIGALRGLAGAIGTVSVALATTPVGWVIIAIVALIAGLIIAYKKVKWFRDGVDWYIDLVGRRFETLKGIVADVVGFLVARFHDVMGVVKTVWGFIGPYVMIAVEAWKKIIFEVVPVIYNMVRTYFGLVFTVISTVLKAVGAVIAWNWNTYGGFIWNSLKEIWGVVKTGWKILTTIIGGALGVIGAAINLWWKLYGHYIWDSLKKIVHDVRVAWDWVWEKTQQIYEFLKPYIQKAWVLIQKYIIQPLRTIIKAVRDAWNWIDHHIVSKALNIIHTLQMFGTKVVNVFSDARQWLIDAGSDIIGGLVDGIRSGFQAVEDALNWLTDHIPDWKGPKSRDSSLLYAAGVSIISGLIRGIVDAIPGLVSVLGWVTDHIPDWKGPRDRDRSLLYDAGVAIMDGLNNGLTAGFAKVRSTLTGITDAIGSTDLGFGTSPSPSGSKAVDQLRTSTIAQRVQHKLMEEARKAAIEENRLRAKLPLLEGKARKDALKEINRLQEQQEKAIQKSKGVRAIAQLRKERQEHLKAADRAAKQAQVLQSKLPGLKGAERRQAKTQIEALEQKREDELKKAKNVQTELIKTFRDLPDGIRKLLNQARKDLDEKNAKARQKERRQEKGGTGGGLGPSGLAKDPVYTRLTPGFPETHGEARHKGHRLDEVSKYSKKTQDLISKFGPKVIDVLQHETTDHSVLRAVQQNYHAMTDVQGAVVDANKLARRSALETRSELKLGLSSNAQNIRSKIDQAKAEAREDSRSAKAMAVQQFGTTRQKLAAVGVTISREAHFDAVGLINAVGQVEAAVTRTRPTSPLAPTGGGHGGRQRGDPGVAGKTVNYNVTLNNPKHETDEESITRTLRNREVVGRRG